MKAPVETKTTLANIGFVAVDKPNAVTEAGRKARATVEARLRERLSIKEAKLKKT